MNLSQRLARLRTRLEAIEGTSEVLSEIDDFAEQVKPYDGLDPKGAREAIAKLPELTRLQQTLSQTATERDQFKTQAEKLGESTQDLRTQVVVARGLGSLGVLPEYQELVEPAVRSLVQVGEDGTPSLPDGFGSTLRDKYPAMFAPLTDGAGSGTGEGQPARTEGPRQVAPKGGVIKGVNPADVLSGRVAITS